MYGRCLDNIQDGRKIINLVIDKIPPPLLYPPPLPSLTCRAAQSATPGPINLPWQYQSPGKTTYQVNLI